MGVTVGVLVIVAFTLGVPLMKTLPAIVVVPCADVGTALVVGFTTSTCKALVCAGAGRLVKKLSHNADKPSPRATRTMRMIFFIVVFLRANYLKRRETCGRLSPLSGTWGIRLSDPEYILMY